MAHPDLPRCDLCAGRHPQPDPDGRVELVVCPEHTGQLNRAGNTSAGLDPDQEGRDYGHLPGPSPALAALLPPDGQHWHLTLPGVTDLAIARILDATA